MNITFSGYATISVKYRGPTNTRGSRMEVKKQGDSRHKLKTYSYDYEKDATQNFMQAVHTFCEEMDWEGHMVGGNTSEGATFIFTRFENAKRVKS